jgi:hypothetical protein
MQMQSLQSLEIRNLLNVHPVTKFDVVVKRTHLRYHKPLAPPTEVHQFSLDFPAQ